MIIIFEEEEREYKMTVGFILIKATSNYEHKVYDKLSKLSEIVKLHPASGEYHFIAQIETDSYDKLKSIDVEKIKSIEGVLRTKIITEPKF